MSQGPKDKIDDAIAKADAALSEDDKVAPVMVAQANLVRNGGLVRVVVPADFKDEDFVAVIELTMALLAQAKQRAAQRPDGLIVPEAPKLVAVNGAKLS